MVARPRATPTFLRQGILVPAAIAVIAGLAGVLLLASGLGYFGPSESPGVAAPPPGSVPVPIAARPIDALSEVKLEDLVDPATGALAVVHLPEQSILPETISDPRELVGRVLAVEKQRGRIFTRGDLLPRGTRPGLVAGIPAGKRAMRVDAKQVGGLAGLSRGDHFDLVATRSLPGRVTPSTGIVLPRASEAVVVDGVIVSPLSRRSVSGADAGSGVLEEVVIAIDPVEVPMLTEALASGSRIDCVPHSGRPGEASKPSIAERRVGGSAIVETLMGTQRATTAVPRAGAGS